MDMQELTENKPLFFGIIGGIVLIVVLTVSLSVAIYTGMKNSGKPAQVSGEPLKDDVNLLTTDNIGKAIEIQALLAKYDIAVSRKLDGTKSILYLKKGDCKREEKPATYPTEILRW